MTIGNVSLGRVAPHLILSRLPLRDVPPLGEMTDECVITYESILKMKRYSFIVLHLLIKKLQQRYKSFGTAGIQYINNNNKTYCSSLIIMFNQTETRQCFEVMVQ